MRNLKTCISGTFEMIRPAKRLIFLTVLLGAFRIILSLFFVWICKTLVDIATGVSDKSLYLFVFLLIAEVILNVVVASTYSYVENLNVLKTTNNLRYNLFSHILKSEWKGKEPFLSGDMVNRIEEDVRVIVDSMVSQFPDVIVTLLQLCAASLYLLTLSPNLMWILIALMVVAVLSSKLFYLKIRKLSNKIRELDSSVQQLIQENLQNRVMVLTLIGVSKVLNKLFAIQGNLEKNTKERLSINYIARLCLRFGFMSGYVAAFLWGIFGIRDGVVTYGMMTAFLQLVGQIQSPIVNLCNKIPAFIHAISSAERIMDLQELPREVRTHDIMISHAPEIKINNLSFRYDDKSKWILSNLNFIFPAGEISVISGPTGVGKSTLIKLLLALLKPVSGNIEIDGTKISPDTRCNFMYVPQGNLIMSGTIRDNLLLANPEATDDEINNVLKVSCADFVYKKELGLDTICSESGGGLSEGQAQRISIARALLHTGSVMILDESTSSLDLQTEEKILQNIHENYHGKKTIIFISHRPAVFKYADNILKLKSDD